MKKIIELTKAEVRDALVEFIENQGNDYTLSDNTKVVLRFVDHSVPGGEAVVGLDELMNVTLTVED